MTDRPRLTPELYRESLNARLKLAEMKLHRRLAERWESEVDPGLRAHYARRYRELIGADPSEREELREALGRVIEGGGATVEEVIERIRFQSRRLD